MTRLLTLIIGLGLLLACSACSKFANQTGTPANQQSSSPPKGLPGQTGWDPGEACAYLSDKLQPGPYKNEGGNIFGCLSSAKTLSDTPLPNNIVYRVRGDALRARQVELILIVNNPETANDAHQTLVEYSEELSMKALGVPISQGLAGSILSGYGGSGRVDTTKVEVLRHNFSTGRGYELLFIITPRL